MKSGFLVASLFLSIIPASAVRNFKPFAIREIRHAVSEPLSEIAKTSGPPSFHGWIEKEEDGSLNKVTRTNSCVRWISISSKTSQIRSASEGGRTECR
jgi:hypothetical protein